MAQPNIDALIATRAVRIGHLNPVYSVGYAGYLGVLFLVGMFGANAGMAYKTAMAVTVVAVGLYATLSSKAAMDELAQVNRDVIAAAAGTSLATHLSTIPIAMFNALTALFNLAIVVVTLWAIYSA